MRYLQHRSRQTLSSTTRAFISAGIVVVAIFVIRIVSPFIQPWVFDLVGAVRGGDIAASQQTQIMQEDYAALMRDYNVLRGYTGTSLRGRVISHPFNAPRDTLLARMTDVVVGDVVYADPNNRYALGTVTEYGSDVARVTLFSEAHTETIAKLGDQRIPVTIVGYGGGEMRINLARDIAVAVGDPVYLSDGESLLGHVESVVALESDPVQVLRLRLFENSITIQFVYFEV